jgi:general secretion pathway protein G
MKSSVLRARPDSAYTLFEIMLVLGIIAVLVGSAIFLLGNQVDIAKIGRVDTDAQAVTTALKTYEMMNYAMPTTAQGLQALVTRPSAEPVPRRWTQYMTAVPLDPWGTPYQYANPGRKNSASFDFYSAGPDRQPGTADDKWPSN